MDISEVLEKSKQNHFLLGVLFGNIQESARNNNLYVYSDYGSQAAVIGRNFTDKEMHETNGNLCQKTGLHWLVKPNNNDICTKLGISIKKHLAVFENAENLSYLQVYNKILTIIASNKNIDRKHFLAGFYCCRASLDQNRKTVTIDYWHNSKYELETKTRTLLGMFTLQELDAVMPINFRELQHQYLQGINKRKTQFRIKAHWFYENSYLINPYKAACLEKIYGNMEPFVPNITGHDFLKRLDNFSKYIYDVNDSVATANIQTYRKTIYAQGAIVSQNTRDQRLIGIVREILPDECAGCYNKYNIMDRTFPHKNRDNKPYLEIHHIIPLANNQDLDVQFNLSKLCPACHASLKRGRAEEKHQKLVIKSILGHSSIDIESIQMYLETSNHMETIDSICERLK